MALSANAALLMRNTGAKALRSRVIKTAKKIYKHAIVTQIAGTTGNPAEPATNDAGANRYLGIATDECLTGDGTRVVQLIDGPGLEVQFPLKTSVTKGMVNDLMYAFDDATCTQLATLGPPMGILVEWTSANLGWVALRIPAIADQT